MKKLKLYIDTSVWNYYFADDLPEKKQITLDFFSAVEKKIYEIFISPVVLEEIEQAPPAKKQQLFALINQYQPAIIETSEESVKLAKLYVKEGIISEKKMADALHVAIASIAEVDALITWNYQHLANLRRKDLFMSINLQQGYSKDIDLITPMGVTDI